MPRHRVAFAPLDVVDLEESRQLGLLAAEAERDHLDDGSPSSAPA